MTVSLSILRKEDQNWWICDRRLLDTGTAVSRPSPAFARLLLFYVAEERSSLRFQNAIEMQNMISRIARK